MMELARLVVPIHRLSHLEHCTAQDGAGPGAYLVPKAIPTRAVQRRQILDGHHDALGPFRDALEPLRCVYDIPLPPLSSPLRYGSPSDPHGCCHDEATCSAVLPMPAQSAKALALPSLMERLEIWPAAGYKSEYRAEQ